MNYTTVFALLKSFASGLSGVVGPITYTSIVVGASATTAAYTFGTNGTGTFNPTQGPGIGQYLGVPGPELAGGLPMLALVAAFAGYRYFRGQRAQKLTQ